MLISFVVAMSENRVIGKDNALPWHLPADLQHFKKLTTGKTIIMGRKTFQSIGKPLPNRRNIVITRDKHFTAPGCDIANSIEQALAMVSTEAEVFVIGGEKLFSQLLPQASRVYLTLIHANIYGDTYFSELPASEWGQIDRKDFSSDEKNSYSYSFITFERV